MPDDIFILDDIVQQSWLFAQVAPPVHPSHRTLCSASPRLSRGQGKRAAAKTFCTYPGVNINDNLVTILSLGWDSRLASEKMFVSPFVRFNIESTR